MTDDKGQIIARKDFGAFGDETATAQRTEQLGYKPENIRQDYTGYQKDDESGLEFAQARYYNSSHGRFTSIDPLTASASIKDPQTFNRYTYALNSPYKFTDPLGLISEYAGSACGLRCASSEAGLGVQLGNDSKHVSSYFAKEQQAEQAETPPTPTAEQNQDDPPLTRQDYLAEALNRITKVIVSGGGKPSTDGIMELDQNITETVTTALDDAYDRGEIVGGIAKAAGGKVVLASTSFEKGVATGGALTLSKDGISTEISGQESSSKANTFDILAAEAIKQDVKELATNTNTVSNAVDKLDGTPVNVTTANGIEKGIVSDRGFWRKVISKEVDLMYRRGVTNGYTNTSSNPSLGKKNK